MPRPARLRRRADGLLAGSLLLVSAVLVAWTFLFPAAARSADRLLPSLTSDPSHSVVLGVAAAAGLACFVITAAAAYALSRRDTAHLTAGVTAAAAAAAAAAILVAAWAAVEGVRFRSVPYGGRSSAFLVDTVVVAFAVGSEVVRRGGWRRWTTGSILVLLAVSVADGSLTLFGLVLALTVGGALGYLLRFVLRASTMRPGPEQLLSSLASRGLSVSGLRPAHRDRSETYRGFLPDGREVEIHLADRDSRLTGLARRLWSLLRLRTAVAGNLPLNSRSRLRDVALVCCLAEGSGVAAPKLQLLEQVGDETLVLATSRPPGPCLSGPVSEETAKGLFSSLRALHAVGVAHRHLGPDSLVTGDRPGFATLDQAQPAATDLLRRLDVAQLLTTVAQASDARTAVQAMRDVYPPEQATEIASVLQPVALASWGLSAMRAARGSLVELRAELIGPDTPVPSVRLERFRWRTVLSVAALVLAAYVVAGQLSTVDLVGSLRKMSLAWFAAALGGSALTYVAAAINLNAFLPHRVSVVRTSLVQLAAGFVGVAMPSTLGYVAVNARYLSRQRLEQASIAAAITLSQVSNVVTTVLTVVVLAFLTGSGLSPARLVPSSDLVLGASALAVVLAALAAVPQTRVHLARLVVPHLRRLIPTLIDAVSRPGRLAISVGASLLLNIGYLLAFIAALVALGAHPPLLPTAIVYLVGSFVGSAAPTPGGLGGVEAALAAGLATIGIAAGEAIPAVVVFRFATFWIPIPAGWLAYLGLNRDGTL